MTIRTRFSFAFMLVLSSAVFLPAVEAQIADLSVTKTGPDQAAAGADVTYTIHVFNDGPDNSLTATLKDKVPDGTSFVSVAAPAGWSCGNPDPNNFSTRGFVLTADNVMIGGFTLGGTNNPTRIAVRALGPSLSSSALVNVLADPTLELYNANGTVMVSNDDWHSDPTAAAQLTANGLALPDPKESGIFTSLAPPGQFTAIVAGKDGTTGIALVEIYNLK